MVVVVPPLHEQQGITQQMLTYVAEIVDDFPHVKLGPFEVWDDTRLDVLPQCVVHHNVSRRQIDF